jgi:UDP-GlcNAc:undecaprenyl-phosphate GlcNAc-1-phosphate transferase
MNTPFVICFIYFLILIGLELAYFKIASTYQITDHPNQRSSHKKATIRGGGIIFPIAFSISSIYLKLQDRYFIAGLVLISLISFIDDIKPLGNRIRISFHLFSVGLMFCQLGIYDYPIYMILIAFVFVIGSINAVNFMDGINGLTGSFGLLTFLTLYRVNLYFVFIDKRLLVIGIMAMLIFLFFNFRNNARCFAGDVGSVSLAFIIVFFLLKLVLKSGNLTFLLFLLVYGLDTSTTILFRLLRRENIFKAHRTHLYQILVNEYQINHLTVTSIYVLLQLLINIILLNFLPTSNIFILIIAICSFISFTLIRFLMKSTK